MSSTGARLSTQMGGAHPVVRSRRRREQLTVALSSAFAFAVAVTVAVKVPGLSLTLLIGGAVGAVGLAMLVSSTRYGVTVTMVAFYLGCLEGPLKLGSGGGTSVSALRDVIIFSVAGGWFARLIARREQIRMPALGGWVLAWIAIVALEAVNPKTANALKVLGGFRQQLEWVPFFFFGYALIRSRSSFRKLFLVLGVLALANGAVSAYQARLSPTSLGSWGPGYKELVSGKNEEGGSTGLTGRTFSSEGEAHVRPPALGTDAGFAGGVGALALPGILALIAAGRVRRRWLYLLALGALLGIATGLGRLQLVGSVLAVVAFAGLSLNAGPQVRRALLAILGVFALAVPAGVLVISLESPGTFSRYETLNPGSATEGKDVKTSSLTHIPALIEADPFGVGLGTVGAAGGFGGKVENLYEGHGVSAETEYNFVVDELGLPGLVLWVLFTVRLLVLGLFGLRRIENLETRIYLTAMLASLIALTIIGLNGPTMSSAASGPYFWTIAGVFAYWFAGGRRVAVPRRAPTPIRAAPAAAAS